MAGRQRAVLVRMYKPNTYIHMDGAFFFVVFFFMILDLLSFFFWVVWLDWVHSVSLHWKLISLSFSFHSPLSLFRSYKCQDQIVITSNWPQGFRNI